MLPNSNEAAPWGGLFFALVVAGLRPDTWVCGF